MKTQRRKSIGTIETPCFTDGKLGGRYEILKAHDYGPSPDGDALRRLRHKLRLTLQQAADALGCGIVDVSELERGISEPLPPATWADARAAYSKAYGGSR